MRTKNPNENLPTAERLKLALSAVEPPLRDELYAAFHLMNPIQFAGFLLSLEVSDDVKRELLLTKVSQPPAYKGTSLNSLCEDAIQKFWSRLTEQAH
jgi:hypothetical protein